MLHKEYLRLKLVPIENTRDFEFEPMNILKLLALLSRKQSEARKRKQSNFYTHHRRIILEGGYCIYTIIFKHVCPSVRMKSVHTNCIFRIFWWNLIHRPIISYVIKMWNEIKSSLRTSRFPCKVLFFKKIAIKNFLIFKIYSAKIAEQL